MGDIHKNAFVAGNRKLFNSGKYSDLTIRSGDDEYKVHRSILCSRSSFFAVACDGDFKEAEEKIIKLDDDDPGSVKRMLYYLYTLEYSDRETAVKEDTATTVELAPLPVPPQPRPVTSNGEEDAQQAAVPESSTGPSEEPAKQAAAETKMMNNTLVYRIAEKYGIPELKVMAREKFEKLAWSQWPHEGFATIIEVVYSTTPETDHGLRDIITSICAEHIQEILLLPDVSVVISEHGQLGLGITREVVRESCRDKEKLRESVAVEQALADDLAQSKKEVIDRNERLTAILVNARNISFCRHCYRPFTSRIERGDGFGLLPMRVSCIECGTRHDI